MNIRYGRVFNLGGYETERIEIEDAVADDETAEAAVERLKELVNSATSKHQTGWSSKKAGEEW